MAGRDPLSGGRGSGARDPLSNSSRKPKKKGGGLLGTLEHVVTQTPVDIGKAAYHLPGGVVNITKAAALDFRDNALHPSQHGPGHGDRLLNIAEGIGKQTAETLRHPLRHPGDTLLTVLPIASSAARASEGAAAATRAAKAGEGARAVVKAAVKKPKPQPRYVKLPGGQKVDAGTYSRSASSRAVQKGLDRLRERYPDVKFGTRNQYERAGFNRSQNERVKNALRNAPAHQIVAKAKQLKLDKAQRLAIRVVAEEVPLAVRIADTEKFLAESAGRTRKLLQSHLTLLKRAEKYVFDASAHDGRTVPRFRPASADLGHFYEDVRRVANKRERDLTESGALNKDTAANRKSAPGDIIIGGQRQRDLATQLEFGFNPDHAPEVFNNQEGFYVSYRNAKNAKTLGRVPQIGVTNQVGVPRGLSELNHELTGANLHKGNVNPDTVKQVAEDAMRANRVLSLWRQRHDLQKLAKDAPTSKRDIPIRPIWLKNKRWPAEIRAHLDNLEQGLTPEADAQGLAKFRDWVLPAKQDVLTGHVKGVKWIDKRVLDKQNLPSPLVGIGGTTPVKIVDAINQAERAAILFKPGYVLPNLASNVAINIVQQGFAAIPNLRHALLNDHKLPADDIVKIDAGMQNGVVASLGNEGVAKGAVAKIQHGLGKLVDRVPRRASFYYEANRFGYKTADDVHRLLNDPALEDELVRVLREANGEIIDYERLGPLERDLIRRLVFIYPWVKGSTVYSGRFLREHPIQAGAYGQVGEQQAARTQEELGALPSYLQGIFKVGGTDTQPLISNAASVSPFGTPAQVLQTIAGLAEKNPGEAYRLSQFLMPLLQAQARGEQRHHGSTASNFLQGLYEGLPPFALQDRLRHPGNPNKIYPYSPVEALLQYLAGSPSPHTLNRAKANKAAYAEKHPH